MSEKLEKTTKRIIEIIDETHAFEYVITELGQEVHIGYNFARNITPGGGIPAPEYSHRLDYKCPEAFKKRLTD